MVSSWLLVAGDDARRRAALNHLARTGRLCRLFPGVYLHPDVATTLRWRVLALSQWRPTAVVCSGAAAALTYAPDLPVQTIDVATRTRLQVPGFRFTERRIPPGLIGETAGVRVSIPALTALDLCTEVGPDAIDDVLRSRAADLPGLWSAPRSTPGRPGNVDLAAVLRDSRDGPWSAAERLLHQVLRINRIRGWRANYPVRCGDRRYYLDVAFPSVRLVIEVDGRGHDSPYAFEYDRDRHNRLVRAGWTVLHVTWRMLCDDPEAVVSLIRAVARRGSRVTDAG